MPINFKENENTDDVVQYSNEDHAFAASIINDITRAKRLPIALNSEDVFNAVRNESEYFFEHMPYATTEEQLVFDVSAFSLQQKYLESKGFELFTNSLIMPSAVLGVYECFYDSNYTGGRVGLQMARWQLESILMNTMHSQGSQVGIDNYMASMFSSNLIRSSSRQPVVYEYSPLTNIFKVYDLGRRVGSIICKVSLRLPLSALYKDLWYRKYIIAKVIDARCDQIELYGAQLPGDTQINIGVLRDRANRLFDEIKEQMEAEEGADFYMIKT